MNANINMVNFLLFFMTFWLIIQNFDKNIPKFTSLRKFCDNKSWNFNNRSKGLILSIDNTVIHQHAYFASQKMDLGHTKHLLPFHNFANISNVDDLVFKVFCYTTDALIVISLLTNFISFGISIGSEFSKDFLRQSTSRFAIKESLQLAIPILQGIITTEIVTKTSKLITKPVMAKVNFSPTDRKELYYNFSLSRSSLIDDHLIEKCNETTAMHILKHYSFSRLHELYFFANNLKEFGYTLVKYDKQWLNNPKLYEKLRFYSYVEIGLYKRKAIERIENIYSQEDISLINIPPGSAFDDYMANQLFDTISFDDYYAIRIFLSNPNANTDIDIPDVWRIKKAMYSLAIRQYDSFNKAKKKEIILYCKRTNVIQKTTFVSLRQRIMSTNVFLYCNEDSSEWNYYSQILFKTNESHIPVSLQFFKIILKHPFSVIDVKNIDAHSKHYIILPSTKFKLIQEKFTFIHQTNIHFLIMDSYAYIVQNAWLAKIANSVSHYENKINGEDMSEPFERLHCKY
ncbi:uncharacterized protein LOC127280980 isoform X3 [Leptopilina boulardi]|uniref:uncharacterized protein LOC127280980 isoform X3 n=1 Tax=Leptopilina boulardi TaxID=63433 RepID=UPI0021F6811A|nr:uncharacterized protein LOC127280980 isoform X3 [Leptopilina boulardi]XP_051160406.1 uncharacterized protein LOC127280980 isoform X3 [Leptopilina boulardi]XP_051160408.1 uncharacterized protein LOC127280980 isoform X3 [Leptopilina boulardi]XP_051160409.1 uncharacterized protein LOC127280980 isoform X3 [Leptopilina boulardi]